MSEDLRTDHVKLESPSILIKKFFLPGHWGLGPLPPLSTPLQNYRKTVQGNRGVSPEEEKEGYGGKDLWKRKVLSLE